MRITDHASCRGHRGRGVIGASPVFERGPTWWAGPVILFSVGGGGVLINRSLRVMALAAAMVGCRGSTSGAGEADVRMPEIGEVPAGVLLREQQLRFDQRPRHGIIGTPAFVL